MENLELSLAYMMLTGFALENAVKALLVKNRPELVKRGKRLRWPDDGHNLRSLFDEARVSFSATEGDLLDRLTEFVRWRGRYPSPLGAEDLMPRAAVPGGGTPYLMPMTDHKLAVGLFSRLTDLVGSSR